MDDIDNNSLKWFNGEPGKESDHTAYTQRLTAMFTHLKVFISVVSDYFKLVTPSNESSFQSIINLLLAPRHRRRPVVMSGQQVVLSQQLTVT